MIGAMWAVWAFVAPGLVAMVGIPTAFFLASLGWHAGQNLMGDEGGYDEKREG